MFTRARLNISTLPDTWPEAKSILVQTLLGFFDTLNKPGAISLDNADIRAATGILFPSGGGALSSDTHTLDDYQEGMWTPVITAATGAITSYSATGKYKKVGGIVLVNINITIVTNGTGASHINSTLPFLPDDFYSGDGIISPAIAASSVFYNNSGSPLCEIYKYDGTYPGSSGALIRVAGMYGTTS